MVSEVLEHLTLRFSQKLPPWLLPGDFPLREIYGKDKINKAGCRGNDFFWESLCLEILGIYVLTVQDLLQNH